MATKGIDMLVKIGIEVVALQKGATLNRSADTIDKTTKQSGGWKEFDASFKEWSIDCDGLYTLPTATGTSAMKALETAFANGTPVTVEFVLASFTGLATGDTEGWTGSAIIVDFPLEAPQDDSVTFSVSFQGSGALTPVLKTV